MTDAYSLFAAIIALVTSITLVFTTDRFGRRNIVLTSVTICTLMLLIVGILGFVPKTGPLKKLLIVIACLWSFFNTARESASELLFPLIILLLLISKIVGNLGWSFVGEVASQKLRARTAGLAAGISVLFGLTFNTSVPIISKSSSCISIQIIS